MKTDHNVVAASFQIALLKNILLANGFGSGYLNQPLNLTHLIFSLKYFYQLYCTFMLVIICSMAGPVRLYIVYVCIMYIGIDLVAYIILI